MLLNISDQFDDASAFGRAIHAYKYILVISADECRMINSIKVISILFIIFIFNVNVYAQNKVVVIPLGDSPNSSILMWVVVDANGTPVRRSDGVTSSVLLSGAFPTGEYAVVFDRDISGCAYQATAGRPGVNVGPLPGYAQVANWQGDSDNGMFVITRDQNSTGVAETRGFHLLVTC